MGEKSLLIQILERAIKAHKELDPKNGIPSFARLLKMDRDKLKRILQGKIPFNETLEDLRIKLLISDKDWWVIQEEIDEARALIREKKPSAEKEELHQKRPPNQNVWDEFL